MSETFGQRISREFCREMPQERNSQEDLAALVDARLAPMVDVIRRAATALPVLATVLESAGLDGSDIAREMLAECNAVLGAARLPAEPARAWAADRPESPGFYAVQYRDGSGGYLELYVSLAGDLRCRGTGLLASELTGVARFLGPLDPLSDGPLSPPPSSSQEAARLREALEAIADGELRESDMVSRARAALKEGAPNER